MIFQSLFQTLPMLVVEKIIEYLVGHPRNPFDDNIKKHNKKNILYPLLSVSEIWCEAALVSICDSCEVVFNDARGIFDENYPAWPKGVSYSGFRREHLVKRVVMTAPGWRDICYQTSREANAWSQYEGAIFLSATNLVVKLKSKSDPSLMDKYATLPTPRPDKVDIANTSVQGWTTVEGVIPFPVLSQLVIGCAYPFDDDALFRGNRETLQRFSIPFDAIAKNALGRPGVFERGDVIRMNPINTVLITGTSCHIPSANLTPERLHRILESSKTLKLGCDPIYGRRFDSRVFNALCTAPSTAILQHLTLFGLNCAIGNIISIVSALPSLVSLTSQIHGSATRIGLIPENEHPSTLYEKYYPLSNNFRVLHVPSVANADIGRVSIVAMQIAVVCPNFAYVDLYLELRKGFKGKVTVLEKWPI
ncbi:hypothetical protein GGH94_001612 [Coemansia aciculifera]|uniref:Uncharacterized protein n=1 Tax=Coemansia aciculifera TaxID=417176 RepID=A0A9W8IKF5_9FUNG|nr:hypothetical protein GGH94_001612 [Coemansia aciculifera]